MCKAQWVLAILALSHAAGLAHSWDIAVSYENCVDFYTNETYSFGVDFGSQNIGALAYHIVHNRLLYVEKQSGNDTVCGYHFDVNKYRCYIKRNNINIRDLAFDPVTELMFFSDLNSRSIYWFSLKTGFKNNVHGNLLIKMDQGIPTDIAVGICRGYVYWINTNLPTSTIERVHFDGSGREVIININSLYVNSTYTLHPHSLTIDQETQKIYWIEPVTTETFHVYYTDLNGNNKHDLMNLVFDDTSFANPPSNTLTVSKTYLYWVDWRSKMNKEIYIRKYGKITDTGISKPINLNTASIIVGIEANYEISLASYLQNNCGGSFCVHGTQVGQLLCKCTPGYIGERCEVSVCDNYCIQGNCSLNDDGHPKCRCHDGYSGERCEVNECHGFCLNSGVCSLDEADEPSCECSAGYEGSRCETVQNSCKTQNNNIGMGMKGGMGMGY